MKQMTGMSASNLIKVRHVEVRVFVPGQAPESVVCTDCGKLKCANFFAHYGVSDVYMAGIDCCNAMTLRHLSHSAGRGYVYVSMADDSNVTSLVQEIARVWNLSTFVGGVSRGFERLMGVDPEPEPATDADPYEGMTSKEFFNHVMGGPPPKESK